MKRILKEIELVTGIKPIPLASTTVVKSIVYKFAHTSKFEYRLEIRIIGSTVAEVEDIAYEVTEGICDFGDTPKIDGINSIVQNGGGLLEDNETKTIQKLLYFDVIIKDEEVGLGIRNYNNLLNKPQINGVELQGSLTLEDLGITNEIYWQ